MPRRVLVPAGMSAPLAECQSQLMLRTVEQPPHGHARRTAVLGRFAKSPASGGGLCCARRRFQLGGSPSNQHVAPRRPLLRATPRVVPESVCPSFAHARNRDAHARPTPCRVGVDPLLIHACSWAGVQLGSVIPTVRGRYFELVLTVKLLRPLVRRFLRTLRPAVVDMRLRKPCTRFRRFLCGW